MEQSQLLLVLSASFRLDYHSGLTCGQCVVFTVCPSFVYGVAETRFECAKSLLSIRIRAIWEGTEDSGCEIHGLILISECTKGEGGGLADLT